MAHECHSVNQGRLFCKSHLEPYDERDSEAKSGLSGKDRLIRDAASAVCQALGLRHWLRGSGECPDPKKLLEVPRAHLGAQP